MAEPGFKPTAVDIKASFLNKSQCLHFMTCETEQLHNPDSSDLVDSLLVSNKN